MELYCVISIYVGVMEEIDIVRARFSTVVSNYNFILDTTIQYAVRHEIFQSKKEFATINEFILYCIMVFICYLTHDLSASNLTSLIITPSLLK